MKTLALFASLTALAAAACGEEFAPCATLRHGAVANYNTLDGLEECKIIDGSVGGPSKVCSVWSGSEDDIVVPERSTFCAATMDIFPLKTISVRLIGARSRPEGGRTYDQTGAPPDTCFNTGNDEFVYELRLYNEQYDGKGFPFEGTESETITFAPGTKVCSLEVNVPKPTAVGARVTRFEINQLAPADTDTTVGPLAFTNWQME